MSDLTNVISGLKRKSAARENPGDFGRDGLLYCGKCGMAKQCRIDLGTGPITVGCTCRCEQEVDEAKRKALREQEDAMRIAELRVQGIQDRAMRSFTFEQSWDRECLREMPGIRGTLAGEPAGKFRPAHGGKAWRGDDLRRRLHRQRPD